MKKNDYLKKGKRCNVTKIPVKQKANENTFMLQNCKENAVLYNYKMYDLTATIHMDITEYEVMENVTEIIIKNIARVKTNKIAIFGQAGSGKNTLIKNFANKISRNQVPKCFLGTKVLLLDNYFLECPEYVNAIISIMKEYYHAENTTKFVFVFDKFETITENVANEFERNIQCIIDNYDCELELFKIIMLIDTDSIVNEQDIYNYDFWTTTIGVRFVEERNPTKIVEILSNKISELEEIHGTHISKELLILTIYMMYGKGLNDNGIRINYNNFLSMVDYILAIVKLNGKTEVSKQDIVMAYDSDFKAYNQYSEFDKKRIAYHEAGHTILALSLPKEYELLAVKAICDSISDTAGITVVNPKCFFHNTKGLVKTLAFGLGGRVAEEIYGHRSGEGAMGDLDLINNEVIEYICRCGSNNKFGKNFVADPEAISTKQLEILENESKKIISKSYKYAKKVLKKHKKFLKYLAKILYKEGILTGEEVIEMWNKYLSKNNK